MTENICNHTTGPSEIFIPTLLGDILEDSFKNKRPLRIYGPWNPSGTPTLGIVESCDGCYVRFRMIFSDIPKANKELPIRVISLHSIWALDYWEDWDADECAKYKIAEIWRATKMSVDKLSKVEGQDEASARGAECAE